MEGPSVEGPSGAAVEAASALWPAGNHLAASWRERGGGALGEGGGIHTSVPRLAPPASAQSVGWGGRGGLCRTGVTYPRPYPLRAPPPPPCVTGSSSSSSSSSKSDSGRSGSSSSGGVFSSIGRAVTGAMSFGLSGFSWVANGASWVGSLFSRKKTSGKSPKRPYDDFSTPGGPNGCAQRLCPTAVGLSFARGHTSLVRLPPFLMRIVPPLSS